MLYEHGPVLWNRGFAIEGGQAVAGLNANCHVKLALGFAAEDAVCGWNVGVVAADGSANVAVLRDQVIGGIEANPADARQEGVNPGMGGVWSGAIVIFRAAVEITGDVARRDSDVAEEGNHGVREILADALAAHDRFIDRGIDAGVARDVFKVVEEALIEFADERERVIAAFQVQLRGQVEERRGLDGECARKQHLPVVAGADGLV